VWHYRHADVPAGASNDHIGWARKPARVVNRVLTWWTETADTHPSPGRGHRVNPGCDSPLSQRG
jgi:hypothetical protein